MEAKKYKIADKEFTMLFPSYKRCAKVRELLGENFKDAFEADKAVASLKEMLSGELELITDETISFGIVMKVVGDFFLLSKEIE